jgi:hypothetical protein
MRTITLYRALRVSTTYYLGAADLGDLGALLTRGTVELEPNDTDVHDQGRRVITAGQLEIIYAAGEAMREAMRRPRLDEVSVGDHCVVRVVTMSESGVSLPSPFSVEEVETPVVGATVRP